jgi:transposase-like protein
MNCPKCNSERCVKDGIVKNKQRYLCKPCKYRYTVRGIGKPKSLKKFALQLYLEGLGFRSIGRILKVSNVSVLNWVKAFGSKIEEYRQVDENIEIIEMDELHTYIGAKKLLLGMDCY